MVPPRTARLAVATAVTVGSALVGASLGGLRQVDAELAAAPAPARVVLQTRDVVLGGEPDARAVRSGCERRHHHAQSEL